MGIDLSPLRPFSVRPSVIENYMPEPQGAIKKLALITYFLSKPVSLYTLGLLHKKKGVSIDITLNL